MSNLTSAADELEKVARVQAHLALHRYVSSSASPNEINYLKGLGLIPRSGKKNKGRKVKSQKHMPKLAAEKSNPLVSGAIGALSGGLVGGVLSPKALMKPAIAAGAALTGGSLLLSGLLHNKALKEKNQKRRQRLSAASGLAGLSAIIGMYATPFAVRGVASKVSRGKGFANFLQEDLVRKTDPKMHKAMINSFREAKRREAAKILPFRASKARATKVPIKERVGKLFKFPEHPGLWKNSCVFEEFFDEIEKISAGRMFGDDPVSKDFTYSVPTLKQSRSGKITRSSAKAQPFVASRKVVSPVSSLGTIAKPVEPSAWKEEPNRTV